MPLTADRSLSRRFIARLLSSLQCSSLFRPNLHFCSLYNAQTAGLPHNGAQTRHIPKCTTRNERRLSRGGVKTSTTKSEIAAKTLLVASSNFKFPDVQRADINVHKNRCLWHLQMAILLSSPDTGQAIDVLVFSTWVRICLAPVDFVI